MSLIDSTYFHSDINLPAGKYNNINSFIAKYEKEILIKLFGYELYKLIAAYDHTEPEETDQRIRDIIEGKEFDVDDHTYKWNGLINSEKVSIISYYVYYYWMRFNQTKTTSSGESENKKVNADNVSITNKVSLAWASMEELIGLSIDNWYYIGCDETYFNSLFYFMSYYYDTYPEWEWTEIGSVNSFDL